MIHDKDVTKYLSDRKKINAPDHQSLSPAMLREERLKQLKLDNLIGPEFKSF